MSFTPEFKSTLRILALGTIAGLIYLAAGGDSTQLAWFGLGAVGTLIYWHI